MANNRPRALKSETPSKGVWEFLDKNWQGVAIILAIVAVFVWYQALDLGETFDLRKAISGVTTGIKETAQNLTPVAPQAPAIPEEAAPAPSSPSLPSSFTQKAVRGQGITHLARQALDAYITEVKPDVALSREHKIYIEDYLKDQVGDVRIHPNQELSFSQDSIEKAIELSQKLTQNQLANLTKFANRVPSLQAYTPLTR